MSIRVLDSLVAGLTCLLIILSGQLQAAPDRPNILWLIAEDMGPEIACYGTPEVRTPHLDRLAATGVRFATAFTVTPVCSTSRSSFMTGMYASTIGAHNHRSHRGDGFKLPKGVRLLSHRMRDAGYFSANIRQFPEGTSFSCRGKTDWNFKVDTKPFDSSKWQDLKKHQPFFAQVNFSETHRGGAWDTSHTKIQWQADPEKVKIPPYYPDHPVTRKDWAQYLNTVMALDVKIGHVLGLLEKDGLAENTIVIFMGDHGRAHIRGKQWCYDSGLHVPLMIRWPTAFPAPNGFEAGTVNRQLVASIDVSATILDWGGVTKPGNMQGRVLAGSHAEPARQYVFGTRDRCDETVFRIRTVRDARYRYIRNFMPERPFLQINRYKERTYPVIQLMRQLHKEGKLTPVQAVLMAPSRPAEELYDLQADSYEIKNLAGLPEHADTLKRLRGVLEDWIIKTDDLGRFPEPPEVLKATQERRAIPNPKKKTNKSGK